MEMIHAIGLPGGPEFILILFVLSPILISFLAVIDIVRHDFNPRQNRLIWLLVALLLPYVGGILYFIIGRKTRIVKESV